MGGELPLAAISLVLARVFVIIEKLVHLPQSRRQATLLRPMNSPSEVRFYLVQKPVAQYAGHPLREAANNC